MAPQPPPKRVKNGSIMDYMKPRPQSRSRPQHKLQNREAESQSKYLKTPAKPYDRAEQKAGASSTSTNDRQSPGHNADTAPPNQPILSQGKSSISEKPEQGNDRNTLTLHESIGDIFTAPPNTLLIHACNCQGSWGAGIAAAFRKHYQGAFNIYRDHCRKYSSEDLFGTALLIKPQKQDFSGKNNRNPNFIGCLFTSKSMGRKKDSPSQILDATGPAMLDLMVQTSSWNARADEAKKVDEVRMCKINSGLFAVPWEETVAVLEDIVVDEGGFGRVEVVSRDE